MPDARPLLLALALETTPLGMVRLARYAWRGSAYVATPVVEPDEVLGRLAIAALAEALHLNGGLSSRGS